MTTQAPRHLALAALLILAACGSQPEEAARAAPARDQQPAAGPAAQAENEQPPLPEPGWREDYDAMRTRLDLTADQAARLEAAFAAQTRALEAWWSEHGSTLVRHEQDIKQAARSRNLAALRQASAQAKPLREEFRDIGGAQTRQALVEALPPAKRGQWDAVRLQLKFEKLTLDHFTLSPEQQQRADALARQHAADADPDPSVDNRLAGPFLHFERALENEVLDPEQKSAYEKIKEENALRSLIW